MILAGRDLKRETLEARRDLLEQQGRAEARRAGALHRATRGRPAGPDPFSEGAGLEGLVAKRRDSRYEPGLRSGAWMKMRINRGQEFVIGGYTLGTKTFDALIVGYYEGDRLIYAARTRNGFTPADARAAVQEIPSAGDRRLPVCESPGERRAAGGEKD